jgi:outer membrane lipoprotein-sorting protein
MNDDHAPFEDRDIINVYRASAAPVPADHRSRLRAQLQAASLTGRPRRRLPGSPLMRLSAAVALILAAVAAFSPLAYQHTSVVSAQTLLRQAVAALASQSYSGSMTVTTTFSFPDVAGTIEAGIDQREIRFSSRDGSHFRVQVVTNQPAIDAGTETLVANHALTVYDDRSNTYTRTRSYGFTIFDLTGIPYLAGQFLGTFPSFQAAITRLSQVTGQKASTDGQETIAGRAAQIVSVRAGGMQIRVWIDRDHPFILKWEETGLDSTMYSMQVTSIHYGKGPSTAALRFHPPVSATNNHLNVCTPGCGPNGVFIESSWNARQFPGYYFVPPPPSLPVAERKFYQVVSHLDPFTGQILGPGIAYGGSGASVASRDPGWPVFNFTQPYVFIQERVDVRGLPDALKSGSRHTAGTCRFWAGALPNGVRTITLQRGKVSISVHTTALASDDLGYYAQRILCKLR